MTKIQTVRSLTLLGYGLLIALLVMWYGIWSPSEQLPRGFVLTLLLLPLLFPLWGLIKGKAYTHAWTSMLILFYFMHGVGEAWTTPEDRTYAIIEIVLSIVVYLGSLVYVKLARQQKAA